jgi:hypothetical protein
MSAESEYEALERRRLDRGPAFESLIERLADIVGRSGAERNEQTLRDLLDHSLRGYGWRVPLYEPPSLPEIAKPLARAVEFLKRDGCEAELVEALGVNDWTWNRSAMRSRLSLLKADLERLERAASRPWPYRVKEGRRPNHKLLFLVRELAEKWVIMTDKPFTQEWHRSTNEPISLGAQFVEAVVHYLDPKSLPALPKMLERVVAERSLPVTRGNREISEAIPLSLRA